MSSQPIVITWHEENLSDFKSSANGNRNDNLNTQAFNSFQLALGDDNLSVSTVESDYLAAGVALGLEESAVKRSIHSALDGAKRKPRDLHIGNGNSGGQENVSKADLMIAPVYTALEDYALAHGTPVKAFIDASWTEGEHQNRKCLFVPCEDGVTRARFLDGENPKWKPTTSGHKPCWYGFNRAVAMAAKSKDKTIVLCNGQPSVITAQHYGIPALAQTDGEGKKITAPLFKRLQAAIKEHKLTVMLAYDGDDTGRKSTKDICEQLQVNGIKVRIVHFGGDDHYDLADYCKQHKTGIMDKLNRLSSFSDKQVKPVLSRVELSVSVENMVSLTEFNLPCGELLVVPFKRFHSLGGYAYIIEPGKMTKVLSPSGCGKTSFLETWNDMWNMQGFDTMWFSPEWTPISLQYRSIQRHTGITTDTIRRHILWEVEKQRGIPEDKRMGKKMSKTNGNGDYTKYLKINEKIAKWPGITYAFQGQKVTEEILAAMTKQLHLLRRNGRRVGVAFFDYAQLLHTITEEKGRNSYEIICDEIKTWCIENDIHAFIGSQPTKAVGYASIRDGTLLGKYDSMWVRPDAFNTIITLNVKHKLEGDNHVPTSYAVANICKNSEGKEGAIKLKTNFSHLCWLDEDWQ